MNKHLRWIVLGAAATTMGIAMPSCPGQQAMQEQIDQLQKNNVALNQRIQKLEVNVTGMTGELNAAKTQLQQIGPFIQGKMAELDQLKATVTELQARVPAKPAKGAKGGTKARAR